MQRVTRSQNLFRNEAWQMKVARHNHSSGLEIGFELRCQITHYIRKEVAENNVGLRQVCCPKIAPFYLYASQTEAQELSLQIREKIQLVSQRSGTISFSNLAKNSPIPATNVDEELAWLHRYRVHKGGDSCSGGRDVQCSSSKRKNQGCAKNVGKFEHEEQRSDNQKYQNPRVHLIVSRGMPQGVGVGFSSQV